jgi:hypothetical protein
VENLKRLYIHLLHYTHFQMLQDATYFTRKNINNMHILTLDNTAYAMNEIPDEVDDLRFAILDNSNPKNPDYYFIPLIFLESFNSPALVLRIGENIVKMPADWQILIGEEEIGDLEVIPLTSINDRGFSAFTFNPLSSYRPEFYDIEVVDIYQDVKWYFPKLRPGQLLSIALHEGNEPTCAYFIKDVSRQCEVVDYSKIW